MNNIEEYRKITNELYKFYQEIKINNFAEISKYLNKEKREKLLNIDFTKQFYISSNNQKDFIHYDKEKNIFLLSLKHAKEKYNDLKNKESIERHYKYTPYTIYTEQELAYIINENNISFEDYIKGEFLYEIFKSIVDLQINDLIVYEDDFGKYSKQRGHYLTLSVIEYLTRDFALKNNIFYLPKLEYQESLKKLLYLFFDDNISIIFNGNINDIYRLNNTILNNNITKLENKLFEKEYKIR